MFHNSFRSNTHFFIKTQNVCNNILEMWYNDTNTHPFNGPLSETTWVSWYQKGKPNLDFTEAGDSEWQWHQLGHMQVCTSLQTDNHASTPPLSFYRPDALHATQPTASKHWRHNLNHNKLDVCYSVILHSSGESTWWQHYLVNDGKASNALTWILYNESAMLPPKRVKGDLCSFHQNTGWLSLFQKNIFPFSYVEPFGYNKASNFRQNLAQFPPLPENRVTRWRIQLQDINITLYLQVT